MRILFFSLLFCVLLIVETSSALARDIKSGIFSRIEIDGIYKASNFGRPSGGEAVFSGTGWGTSGELKATGKGYGIGVKLSYSKINQTNTSNTATASENLSGSTISIVPRIYALDLYVGLGVTYDSIQYNRDLSGTTTTEQYSGLGVKFELGYDFFLGRSVFISPGASYQISKVRSESSVSQSSLNSFEGKIGIGLEF